MRVLLRLFRRSFVEELAQAHSRGQLHFFGEYADLSDAAVFAQWLAPLRQCEWVVYAKRPFAGPQAVLAYLAPLPTGSPSPTVGSWPLTDAV